MFITPAYAQAATTGAGNPLTDQLIGLAPLLIMLVIFYFLLIRPQQRRLKQHQDMLAALKKGDTVVTAGGLIGKVRSVADDEVRVELAPNVEVRAVRSTISEVRGKGEPAPANDSKAAD